MDTQVLQVRVSDHDLFKENVTYFTANWELTGSAGEKHGLLPTK